MNRRPTFQTPYDQFASRRGEPFSVVRSITIPDETHDEEVLPMYEIQFGDGFRAEAWPEEVYTDQGWEPS